MPSTPTVGWVGSHTCTAGGPVALLRGFCAAPAASPTATLGSETRWAGQTGRRLPLAYQAAAGGGTHHVLVHDLVVKQGLCQLRLLVGQVVDQVGVRQLDHLLDAPVGKKGRSEELGGSQAAPTAGGGSVGSSVGGMAAPSRGGVGSILQPFL